MTRTPPSPDYRLIRSRLTRLDQSPRGLTQFAPKSLVYSMYRPVIRGKARDVLKEPPYEN